MTENFAKLFEDSLNQTTTKVGSVLKATVVSIDKENVMVSAGLKSNGIIPLNQFRTSSGDIEIAVGDEVDVVLDELEDGFGETIFSREKAKRAAAWQVLIKANENNETVLGLISNRVKGGFTVELNGVRAFLPGSLVDLRPVKDPDSLVKQTLEFKVIKIDDKRNNVVVSRRAVLESESSERKEVLASLEEGQEIKGIVKNLTDYGAFIDLGGVDGLLHITDMSWKRIKHPSELIKVGEEIPVKVLKFDQEKQRVSLGMKQLGDDPWKDIASRYPVNSRLTGKVTNITDYGCFVEVEEGVEGLVHLSEMDWTNKNVNPNKIVQVGQEVDVLVLEIDESRRRISLGMKQCQENPWDNFSAKYSKNDVITGVIKSITDFGIFIGLEGDIDGLVHMSDVSWDEIKLEDHYQKGDEVQAIILAIDPQRERISLGIKQLDKNAEQSRSKKSGGFVTGTVKEIETKGAVISLENDEEAYLPVNEISREKIEDARTELQVGDTIEAKHIGFDRKTKRTLVSIKAKEAKEENEALRHYTRNSETVSTTLGDIIKNQMDGNGEGEE